MTKTIHPWAIDHPVSSPFAFPEGLLGSLAGRFMVLTYDDREIVEYLELETHHCVLEVGFGAGGLLRRLDDLRPTQVAGVDPSPRMLRDASARNAEAIAAGRMNLRLGTASDTGHEAAHFHRVVSVHNVALWPDLDAGLDELRRVTRPGGMLLLAWHGGRKPHWTTKSLGLAPGKLGRIEQGLTTRFSRVERIRASRDDVFRAWA